MKTRPRGHVIGKRTSAISTKIPAKAKKPEGPSELGIRALRAKFAAWNRFTVDPDGNQELKVRFSQKELDRLFMYRDAEAKRKLPPGTVLFYAAPTYKENPIGVVVRGTSPDSPAHIGVIRPSNRKSLTAYYPTDCNPGQVLVVDYQQANSANKGFSAAADALRDRVMKCSPGNPKELEYLVTELYEKAAGVYLDTTTKQGLSAVESLMDGLVIRMQNLASRRLGYTCDKKKLAEALADPGVYPVPANIYELLSSKCAAMIAFQEFDVNIRFIAQDLSGSADKPSVDLQVPGILAKLNDLISKFEDHVNANSPQALQRFKSKRLEAEGLATDGIGKKLAEILEAFSERVRLIDGRRLELFCVNHPPEGQIKDMPLGFSLLNSALTQFSDFSVFRKLMSDTALDQLQKAAILMADDLVEWRWCNYVKNVLENRVENGSAANGRNRRLSISPGSIDGNGFVSLAELKVVPPKKLAGGSEQESILFSDYLKQYCAAREPDKMSIPTTQFLILISQEGKAEFLFSNLFYSSGSHQPHNSVGDLLVHLKDKDPKAVIFPLVCQDLPIATARDVDEASIYSEYLEAMGSGAQLGVYHSTGERDYSLVMVGEKYEFRQAKLEVDSVAAGIVNKAQDAMMDTHRDTFTKLYGKTIEGEASKPKSPVVIVQDTEDDLPDDLGLLGIPGPEDLANDDLRIVMQSAPKLAVKRGQNGTTLAKIPGQVEIVSSRKPKEQPLPLPIDNQAMKASFEAGLEVFRQEIVNEFGIGTDGSVLNGLDRLVNFMVKSCVGKNSLTYPPMLLEAIEEFKDVMVLVAWHFSAEKYLYRPGLLVRSEKTFLDPTGLDLSLNEASLTQLGAQRADALKAELPEFAKRDPPAAVAIGKHYGPLFAKALGDYSLLLHERASDGSPVMTPDDVQAMVAGLTDDPAARVQQLIEYFEVTRPQLTEAQQAELDGRIARAILCAGDGAKLKEWLARVAD